MALDTPASMAAVTEPNAGPSVGLRAFAIISSGAMGLLGAVAARFISGVSPKWMGLSNAASGGVIIGVALCHMLPENAEVLDPWGKAINSALGGEAGEAAPLGFWLCGLGFFLIVAVEQAFAHDHPVGGKGHGHGDHENGNGRAAREDSASHSESSQDESDGTNDDRAAMHASDRPAGTVVSGWATLVGVSIHSLIEAVATGASDESGALVMIAVAVMLHKGFAAYAVGISLEGVGGSRSLWWMLNLVFILTGPVGILAGILVSASLDGPAASFMQCLASGTLLAIGITHMVQPALEDRGVWKKRKLATAILGFVAMGSLAVWA